jgi:hypothetical protein
MEAIGAIGQWLEKLNESFLMAREIIIHGLFKLV